MSTRLRRKPWIEDGRWHVVVSPSDDTEGNARRLIAASTGRRWTEVRVERVCSYPNDRTEWLDVS